jgi:uncharacterized RDD family membrane protein YckC
VNTICSQCGSVLASGEHACNFCYSSESPQLSRENRHTQGNAEDRAATNEWRGELDQRLQSYRARRRKSPAHVSQGALPFELDVPSPPSKIALAIDDPPAKDVEKDGFAFTIAIGRMAQREPTDPRLLIDVTVPPQTDIVETQAAPERLKPLDNGLLPLASLDDRRRALLIDTACLAFAYGGFLALFGSLGGHFTVSKLSATVCFFTFAFVYLQYFGLFTVFGGSTPGMMVAGIQVASSTGDLPTPRQYMFRALGYVLSAGTCFLGFLWVLWDEDGLTWHDRISKTYLARVESLGDEEISHPVAAR